MLLLEKLLPLFFDTDMVGGCATATFIMQHKMMDN
jgi:hypothetical protein